MKCLSLWQPWASMIFEMDDKGVQLKPDETRPWRTGIRGPIAIHASRRKMSHEDACFYGPFLRCVGLNWLFLPLGVILGTVEIADCRPAEVVALERTETQRFWGDYRAIGDDAKKRYAIELRNPIKFTEPIPWRGRQKFFEVTL